MLDAVSTFGPFAFDREKMKLTRGGKPIQIGSRGLALLTVLVDADGRVVGRDALVEAAWPGAVVEESNLTVQIAALRKALGAGPDGRDWIATVPRAGYRLVSTKPAREEASNRRPSIAVLPFESLSSNPEQAFFADGVVEDIITALSRFKTFAVVARNSSFVFKGRAVDVREVGRELGVRYVLEGSVRRAGKQVRVSAQLIEASTGAHLWAEHFDGTAEDIFDFQDRITDSVIGLIEPQIRKAEIERARRKRPESLDAWDLYMRALPLVYSMNVPTYTEAIELLERAIALDPGYAPALALAAWAHEKRFTFRGTPPGVDDKEMSLALADRALEADEDDATVLALAGWLFTMFRSDCSALAFCARAVALNPNNLLVLNIAGIAHHQCGDLDKAIACHLRALQLSPGAPDNYVSLTGIALIHCSAGRFEEAIKSAQRSIELNKGYVYSYIAVTVGNAHLDRMADAQAALDAALVLDPSLTIAWLRANPRRFPERFTNVLQGLRKAGLPEH